ncbi:MAG: DUF222 domain-containing protein [Actinomycetota bacterium]
MDSGATMTAGTGEWVEIAGVRVRADSVFARLDAALTRLADSDLRPANAPTAANLTRLVEHFGRRLHGVQLVVMDQIDRDGLHRADGHGSVAIHARHNADLSNAEAQNRQKTMRMCRDLPQIRRQLLAGDLSIDKAHLLARVHANPRVSQAMAGRQEGFLAQAHRMPFHMFETRVREWERLVDFDGSEPESERIHRRRNAKLTQDDIDLSWDLAGRFAAGQGAQMAEILDHYIDAERLADWEKARAHKGEQATAADLPRTEQQRRADALWQVFQDAARGDDSAVPPGFCHNVIWSADTYEEMLRRLDGQQPQPFDPDDYCCETTDGVKLDPTEAITNSLQHSFRRVVVDAAGVVVDMGRKRFFTGPLRDAVNIAADGRCIWPGCWTPASKCEADHVTDYGAGGLTNPGNGAPLCGKHNRWKQKGFRIRRHPDGTWTTTRSSGTAIT